MSSKTTNYNLIKPAETDYYNIKNNNDNMDLIDAALKDLEEKKATKVTLEAVKNTVSDLTKNKADKTEIPKIPASLPANGGNADTLDGKHAHELSQKAYLVANGVDLFEYIESLTDEQLPPHGTVIIRAFNCKNSPIDGFPAKVVISQTNGGDFVITVTRLEHKDWYVLSAREMHTNKMFTCGKRGGVWKSWSSLGDIVILPDGTDIEKQFLNNEAADYSWTIRTFRIGNSESAPTNLGYDPKNNDFYYTVYKMGHDWIKLIASDVRSNRQFINSKLGGSWTGWQNIADGGNADTVDGWHVNLTNASWGLKPIYADTFDMTAGVNELAQGHIYIMYE